MVEKTLRTTVTNPSRSSALPLVTRKLTKHRARKRARVGKAFSKILLAVDGSATSRRAARKAIRLARKDGAELIVASVVPKFQYAIPPIVPELGPGAVVPPSAVPGADYYREAAKSSERWIEKAVSPANTWKVKVHKHILNDGSSVAKSITDYAANQKVDLVVVGTSSVGSLKRLVLGSVSTGVVNNATTSVLVVR